MLQLQQLNRPFHVGQTTFAQLQVTVPTHAAWQSLGFHTRLELAYFGDLRLRQIDLRIAQRVGDVHQEILGERRVACRVTRTQERLVLPCARPGTVVFLAGRVGAHEGSVFAFGPQVHVEFDFGFERGRSLQDGAEVFLHFACEEVGLVVVGVIGRPVDDDDVGVGAEVHFPAAVASHADDGDCRRRFVESHFLRLVADGPGERCVDGRVVYVGHTCERRLVVDDAAHPP